MEYQDKVQFVTNSEPLQKRKGKAWAEQREASVQFHLISF